MSLRSRMRKLERAVPASDPLADDPQYQLWRLLYQAALGVLAPFPEARQEVERRIGVNEPCIFRPNWQRTVTGADLRFFLCKQTLWAALEKFPEARQALDQALVEAFGDEATDGEESPVEKHPAQGNGDAGRAPGDAPAGQRETYLGCLDARSRIDRAGERSGRERRTLQLVTILRLRGNSVVFASTKLDVDGHGIQR